MHFNPEGKRGIMGNSEHSYEIISYTVFLMHVHNHVMLCCSSYHIFVVLIGEVESRQDGLELAENLTVPRHVSGQDASAD